MKWGTLYDAEYVNVLFNAARANLTGPFQFVCLTDDATGLDKAIVAHPIPEFGLTPRQWRGGGWPKIAVFLADLYGLSGRALFIDLDMMIVGDLNPFFEYGEGIVAIDEGAWVGKPPSTMSSIFAFDIGGHTELVTKIQPDPDAMEDRYGYEQTYIHHEANHISYWPGPWLASFKRHLRRPVLVDLILAPKRPDEEVKVVVFHGKPRAKDRAIAGQGNRDKLPHYVIAPVDWVRDYWLKYSGSDVSVPPVS
jgi:hypothetical protein